MESPLKKQKLKREDTSKCTDWIKDELSEYIAEDLADIAVQEYAPFYHYVNVPCEDGTQFRFFFPCGKDCKEVDAPKLQCHKDNDLDIRLWSFSYSIDQQRSPLIEEKLETLTFISKVVNVDICLDQGEGIIRYGQHDTYSGSGVTQFATVAIREANLYLDRLRESEKALDKGQESEQSLE